MYEIRISYWEKGLNVHIYEDGVKIGLTQSYKAYRIRDAAQMAREWIFVTKDLPTKSDISIWYNPAMPTES